MSKSGDGAINESGDRITIHLVAPADFPAGIQNPVACGCDVCAPGRFTETAAAAMKVLADPVTRQNQIKACKLR
jgi:hypothetical protein